MTTEALSEDSDCPTCEYEGENDARIVKVQCDACRRSADAIIDFLVAAKVERSNLPRGKA